MTSGTHIALALFAIAYPMVPASHGQSCAQQMRQATASQTAREISAADLQIPAKAWDHFEKARTASATNNPRTVQTEIAQALAIAPRFGEAYLLLAAQQVRDRQYNSALQTIAAARELQPNLGWASVIVASALNQLGRFDEAAAELNRARAEEGDTWQAKFERARAETGRRDIEAALHWSLLAVESAPIGCTDARVVRANALQLAGRRAEAVHELETYLQLDRQGTSRAQVVAALDRIRRDEAAQDKALLAER
ncbi:MAG: hypothetical protein NVS9B15_08580 [Acidobacteriaceae bacterium]